MTMIMVMIMWMSCQSNRDQSRATPPWTAGRSLATWAGTRPSAPGDNCCHHHRHRHQPCCRMCHCLLCSPDSNAWFVTSVHLFWKWGVVRWLILGRALKMRQLCLDALVEEGDLDFDWRLSFSGVIIISIIVVIVNILPIIMIFDIVITIVIVTVLRIFPPSCPRLHSVSGDLPAARKKLRRWSGNSRWVQRMVGQIILDDDYDDDDYDDDGDDYDDYSSWWWVKMDQVCESQHERNPLWKPLFCW